MSNKKRTHYRKSGKDVTRINHNLRDAISGDFPDPIPDPTIGSIIDHPNNKGLEFTSPNDGIQNGGLTDSDFEFKIKEEGPRLVVSAPYGLPSPYSVSHVNPKANVGRHDSYKRRNASPSKRWVSGGKTYSPDVYDPSGDKTSGRIPIDDENQMENIFHILEKGIIFKDTPSSLNELNDKLYAQELYLFHLLRSAMISSSVLYGVSPVELFGNALASGRDDMTYDVNDQDLNELADFLSGLDIIRRVGIIQWDRDANRVPGHAEISVKINRTAPSDILNRVDIPDYSDVMAYSSPNISDGDGDSFVFKNPAVEDTISKLKELRRLFDKFASTEILSRTENGALEVYDLHEDPEPHQNIDEVLFDAVMSGDYDQIDPQVINELGLNTLIPIVERRKVLEFEDNTFYEQPEEVKNRFVFRVLNDYLNASKDRQTKIKRFNQRTRLLGVRGIKNTPSLTPTTRTLFENTIKNQDTRFEAELGMLLQLQKESESNEKTDDLDLLLSEIESGSPKLVLTKAKKPVFEPITFQSISKSHSVSEKN